MVVIAHSHCSWAKNQIAKQLQREQQRGRHGKHQQGGRRRQLLDLFGDQSFERLHRQYGDTALDDRLETVPQPRLDDEDQRDHEPEQPDEGAPHVFCVVPGDLHRV